MSGSASAFNFSISCEWLFELWPLLAVLLFIVLFIAGIWRMAQCVKHNR